MVTSRDAGDYNESLTAASFSALLELALTLRAYKDSLILVGGWAPYLLINDFGRDDFKHVGSIDIDIAVNPATIDAEAYATIIDLIEARGYENRLDRIGNPIIFSYCKTVPSPLDGTEYSISIDFLTVAAPESGRHRHREVQPGLPARIAGGCELAFEFNYPVKFKGILPGNGEAEAELLMLSIPGCIGMKGIVLGERYKEKDAYDIYTVIRYCLSDPLEVAALVTPHLDNEHIATGIDAIRQKFRDINAEGPSWVAFFSSPDPEVKKREQAAAFAVVDEFINGL